ncbi:hypothetical protein MMC28_006550 [Mycoblastus sanguinarius]|nr:hypothetical protein [Mycoblastus sanguinarius]
MIPLTASSPWGKPLIAALAFITLFLLSRHSNIFRFTPHQPTPQPTDSSNFLPLEHARHLCQTHRFNPHTPRTRPRKIYDLFLINTELDWLTIRLGELSSQVDYFIILESSTTFTSTTKPLHVQENWSQFSPYHAKMIHHVLNTTGEIFPDTWSRERFSRNALFTQVLPFLTGETAPQRDDIILVSDVDELPRPSTLEVLRNCAIPKKVTLRSSFYYYSFQWLHRGSQWPHPQATLYAGPSDTTLPDELRSNPPSNGNGDDSGEIWNAAWHCSYCFARLEDMVNKLTSFSHTEMNRPEFTTRSEILRRVRLGVDMFDRGDEVFDRVEGNRDVPGFLLGREGERFEYVLDRDPETGNFVDWREGDVTGVIG